MTNNKAMKTIGARPAAHFLLLAFLALGLQTPATAQTILGRTVYDKFIMSFFSNADTTNANTLALGMRNATAPLIMPKNSSNPNLRGLK